MSFFDEVDEPPERQPRTEARRPRTSGRGGPPRSDQQAIQTRRIVAVVGIVVVVVLLALGIHSCDVSARNSALKDYTNSVYQIVQQSNALGPELFKDLSGGSPSCTGSTSATEATNLSACVTNIASNASGELRSVERLSVPGGMQTAQTSLVYAMKMRRDGLRQIASQTQQAFSASTAAAAVQAIATGTSFLYGSDVVYKGYAAPEIAAALNNAGLRAGPISSGQIVSDLSWLDPTSVTAQMQAPVPGAPKAAAPEFQGYVAVGTNTMIPGVTNHVEASPPPTFVITVKNPGDAPMLAVACQITVLSTPAITAKSSIGEIAAGSTGQCSVQLPTSPTVTSASNPDDVTATISVGLNPKNAKSTTFPVDFLGSSGG